ncbi:MFS transporter [Nocardioides yefusunii]|uniref:MFS transporter n=1 Tax=Nocardioides yefusunii TaxID=2500546 RepID=A0ABW1QW93_9ACTN|nr:MFS transporter [Nocardioides yefusunii]
MTPTGALSRGVRMLLALAALAVGFAAADTYVVVMALPDMMGSVGVGIDELQRAAPIVSGFLLGYVAMLPLIGRIADLRGRVPVLVVSLVVFALGSAVTAVAYDMTSMVGGRFLQGLGGGGLVPATLALVADLYPPHRRGVPLGLVSAVQEIGSVLGPLLGAVVMAVADWRVIFALNLAVGLVLAAGLLALARGTGTAPPRVRRTGWPDFLGALLGLALSAALVLMLLRPGVVMRDLFWGQLFVPFTDTGGRWSTPLGVITCVLAFLFLLRLLTARRPLIDVKPWWHAAREADLLGATFLAIALGGVVLAFATADPQVEVFSAHGRWYLLGSGVGALAFAVHLRTAPSPLVPAGTLRAVPAWGALVVSFLVGSALVAALIDVPLFARTTIHTDSQVDAALELVKFLVALPVGAVLGGYGLRRFGAGPVAALGMLLSGGAFALMASWGLDSLTQWHATPTLLVCGLGFGLALAPVNAAVLAFTDEAVHGLASALVVVARMVGMLVGISVLTTVGLRRYYSETEAVPSIREVCGGTSACSEFTTMLREAGIAQESTVFAGAAVACVAAAVVAALVFRTATRSKVGSSAGLQFRHV